MCLGNRRWGRRFWFFPQGRSCVLKGPQKRGGNNQHEVFSWKGLFWRDFEKFKSYHQQEKTIWRWSFGRWVKNFGGGGVWFAASRPSEIFQGMHLKIVSFIGAITAVLNSTLVSSVGLCISHTQRVMNIPLGPWQKTLQPLALAPTREDQTSCWKKNWGSFFQPDSMFADVSLEINGCICYSFWVCMYIYIYTL